MNNKRDIITVKYAIDYYYDILDMFKKGSHEYNQTLNTINEYKIKLTNLRR